MRRVIAPFSSLVFVCVVALAAAAQVNPPVQPPAGPVNPPAATASPAASVPPSGAPSAAPSGAPSAAPAAAPSVPEASESPAPLATPTQPPIVVEPPQLNVEPGKTASARVNSALGTLSVSVADPTVATAVVDQAQRVLYVSGVNVGTTTVTVTDSRGLTRDVAVRVAYAAGIPADSTTVRVTGSPSTVEFLRDAIATAVEAAATIRPGASVNVDPESVPVRRDLAVDDRTELDVPVAIAGPGYLPVNAVTHVVLENTALPPIQPARLLVSDYPERLTANGVLFTAHLDRLQPQRLLYYHYNPASEPARRIVLKAHNASREPATVQMIDGSAGPGPNEMEIGHLATRRFLVHEARNEGRVIAVPAGATVDLVDHPLPPQSVVNAILQLRLVNGDPIDLALVAQDAAAPANQSIDTTRLLAGGAPHARGVYPVPTFFFDRVYDVEGQDLDIVIGQLPLPNMRQGEALGGDYGVEQSATVVIENASRAPRSVALYANPRGGRATGTFLIDGVVVQAHALAPFSRFKIWQERINAGTFRRIKVVTMPEGGSSYPLRLTFAPDDGSVPPGAPGSPIY